MVLNLDTREIGSEYLDIFEVWCWRRLEISCTDRVRNEVLRRVIGEEYPAYSRRKAKRVGHILRGNCFLRRVIEGEVEGRIL